MIKLKIKEIENNGNLPVKAKLLKEKFEKRSQEEQLQFFENVVKQTIELKTYKEELSSLKNGGVSL